MHTNEDHRAMTAQEPVEAAASGASGPSHRPRLQGRGKDDSAKLLQNDPKQSGISLLVLAGAAGTLHQ